MEDYCGEFRYRFSGQDICIRAPDHDGDHEWAEHDCPDCGSQHGTCRWCGTTHGDTHSNVCPHVTGVYPKGE